MTAARRTIRTLSHCFYDCKYHVVWTPKYRGKLFTEAYVKQEVKRIIESVCTWKGFEVFELNIQEDHVHLVVGIDPRHSISYAMSLIKGKSSKWIKKKNYQKVKAYVDRGSLWARGYFVSTIGMDEHIIRRYVRYQSKKTRLIRCRCGKTEQSARIASKERESHRLFCRWLVTSPHIATTFLFCYTLPRLLQRVSKRDRSVYRTYHEQTTVKQVIQLVDLELYRQAAAELGITVMVIAGPGKLYTTDNGYRCHLSARQAYIRLDNPTNTDFSQLYQRVDVLKKTQRAYN